MQKPDEKPVCEMPKENDRQIFVPEKLKPSAPMRLAMTKHFSNTPAEERV